MPAAHAERPARSLVAALTAVALLAGPARAAGPPVALAGRPGVDASSLRRVREVAAAKRPLRDDLPLPTQASVSTERAAVEQRTAAIRLALDRAKKRESEAAWDDCAREAASAMSDAIEVLAASGELALLRDLHVQVGVCMSLADSPANARPHFLAAAQLDEAPPPQGLHREEAERAQLDARAEVLARKRGTIRIETAPPGAEVWIDGRKAAGATPLDVDVRLGDHFVTVRRFRYEPHTERRVLSPPASARFVLEPARRGTLRDQLGAVARADGPRPTDDEMQLARAAWSRAEQLLVVSPQGPTTMRLELLDTSSGARLRAAAVPRAAGDAALRQAVCDALGETCEPASRGIPWYVWPLAGAVIVGGVVAAGVIMINERDVRFCPEHNC